MHVHTYLSPESEYIEEMQPFTEEDLSILYPNPQLDTQTLLVDTFIRVRNMSASACMVALIVTIIGCNKCSIIRNLSGQVHVPVHLDIHCASVS